MGWWVDVQPMEPFMCFHIILNIRNKNIRNATMHCFGLFACFLGGGGPA